MSGETREQLIGTLALVVLVAVIGFLNQGRELGGVRDGHFRVEALFGRVDGLASGDEVFMSGVRIGTVAGQRLDAGYRALLTLKLQDGVRVPRDSSAAVQTDGLFGAKFVVIQPGASEDLLKSGDRITLTQDAQVVEELLGLIISEGRAALAARKAAEDRGKQEQPKQ